ncbi:M20 family peptidase [Patescibacteria group bacterium]|nr:M20 family peptidase [Patescibacteria group bacterium]
MAKTKATSAHPRLTIHERQLLDRVDKSAKDLIRFTQRLVRARSTNPFLPSPRSFSTEPVEKAAANAVYAELKKLGLSPRYRAAHQNRPNVVCSVGSNKGRSLILNGHLDTVDVGNENDWTHPPFSGVINKGKLYGRGALDMKASIAAMAYALKALAETGLTGKITLAAVVDEETGACSELGSKYLLSQELRADACIVGEPSSEKIRIGHRGVYRFKLISHGQAAHTGSSEWEQQTRGVNAVTKLARALLEIEKLKFPARPNTLFRDKRTIITPGTMVSGGTGINIVPDHAEATVDVRLLPGQTKVQIKRVLQDCLNKLKQKDPKLNLSIEDLVFGGASFINPFERIVTVLQRASKEILGRKPGTAVSGGGNDAHFFTSKGIPAIGGFGPDGDNIHAVDEYAEVESIVAICKVYALTAWRFTSEKTR